MHWKSRKIENEFKFQLERERCEGLNKTCSSKQRILPANEADAASWFPNGPTVTLPDGNRGGGRGGGGGEGGTGDRRGSGGGAGGAGQHSEGITTIRAVPRT